MTTTATRHHNAIHRPTLHDFYDTIRKTSESNCLIRRVVATTTYSSDHRKYSVHIELEKGLALSVTRWEPRAGEGSEKDTKLAEVKEAVGSLLRGSIIDTSATGNKPAMDTYHFLKRFDEIGLRVNGVGYIMG